MRVLCGNIKTQAPCPACGDTERSFTRVRMWWRSHHARRKIAVDVPAGIENGTASAFRQGEVTRRRSPRRPLRRGSRKASPGVPPPGRDLVADLRPDDCRRFGQTITLDTLDGAEDIVIQPGTQPGEEVKIDGLGVGRLHRRGRGRLRARINVEVPTSLSDKQRELLQQLAELRDEERVEAKTGADNAGFFSNLRDKFTR